MGFEQDIDEVKKIVDKLESDNLNLDESIELFKKGTKLAENCQKYLEESEMVVEKLVETEKGLGTEKFE